MSSDLAERLSRFTVERDYRPRESDFRKAEIGDVVGAVIAKEVAQARVELTRQASAFRRRSKAITKDLQDEFDAMSAEGNMPSIDELIPHIEEAVHKRFEQIRRGE